MLSNKNLKNKKLNMQELNIDERRAICEKCPIYSPARAICNPSLWLNPDTDEVSTSPKAGYIRGCNCHVLIKMRNLHNHCIAGKW